MIRLRILMGILSAAALLAACGPSHDGELLWKFETKKAHKQWVALDEERTYLCADDVYCLDKGTGDLLWEFETFGSHSSAPVIADGRLFFQSGGLCALDTATGDMVWEFWSGSWATLSPAVGAGRVFAPAGKELYCFDAGTGKRLWTVKTGRLNQTPVLIGARLFFSRGETIVCLDASDGRMLWRSKVGSDLSRIAAAGDCLLSAGAAGPVRAHRIETGEVRWTLDTGVQPVGFSIVPEGRVIITSDKLYCCDVETGTSLWIFDQDAGFIFDAQLLGHYVYARSAKLGLFRVAIRDGSLGGGLRLPKGGRLLRGTDGVIFFSGGNHRDFNCLLISEL